MPRILWLENESHAGQEAVDAVILPKIRADLDSMARALAEKHAPSVPDGNGGYQFDLEAGYRDIRREMLISLLEALSLEFPEPIDVLMVEKIDKGVFHG